MKKSSFSLLLIILSLSVLTAQSQRKYKMLSEGWKESELPSVVIPIKDWRPYPDINDRKAWHQIPEHQQKLYIEKAEQYLGREWPVLPATLFLEFVRNGNRSHYEKMQFERRTALSALVFAELFENKGRFMDDIVNLIWAICEETYWGVPAHVGVQKAGSGLPDVEEPTVDLFAAETGALLSWVPCLLKEKLDEVSPLITGRIYYEVGRRILTPNLERDDFWWMGFSGRKVNNWNPWINSNWLTCVLLQEQDESRRIRAIHKIMRSLDYFIDGYPDDGGCDEGPNYWGRAGGALFIALELLDQASNNSINLSGEPLIQKMGQYIYKAYVGNGYFVNFADASARARPEPPLIYRFGRYIDDPKMMDFGLYLAKTQDYGKFIISDSWGQFSRIMPALFDYEEMQKKADAPLPRDVWLPQTQLMTARSAEGMTDGFYLAAKGGTNHESHNHNDVGSFMVFYDGYPVFIDVGVETYTAKTFSHERYDIWTMQSAYHNLPLTNGKQQKAGGKYEARDVKYNVNNSSTSLTLDIAKAYPEDAGINYWLRTMTLHRGKDVTITEKYDLKKVTGPLELHFMTIMEPDTSVPGQVILKTKTGNGADVILKLSYDKKHFTAESEHIKVEDQRLLTSWPPDMYRILLKCNDPKKTGKFMVKISKQ